jgi:ABC-type uncharacterized transport system ATPase subunit
MPAVELTHVSKSFGTFKAVDDVSFYIEKGELFGLLGPNGAGKTTCLRCMLDIFKPESGCVSILGGPMGDSKKYLIGYMPEKHGLHRTDPGLVPDFLLNKRRLQPRIAIAPLKKTHQAVYTLLVGQV